MLTEENDNSYSNSGITVTMTEMDQGGFLGNNVLSGGQAAFVFSSTVGNIKGIRLARRTKEINPRVNIIFVTICGEEEHTEAIFRLCVSGYVRKPYEWQQLAEEFVNLRYEL